MLLNRTLEGLLLQLPEHTVSLQLTYANTTRQNYRHYKHCPLTSNANLYHAARPYSYIYRVFTKEWCCLNDYILQLDGAPPFSQDYTRATQSCSPTALNRTCCKWRQPHTHTIWDEFDYRLDVCRVTQGAQIEGLWLMHYKLGQLPLRTVYVLSV
jgi:hypothetical protein